MALSSGLQAKQALKAALREARSLKSGSSRRPVQKGVRRDLCLTAATKAVTDDAAKTATFVVNSDQVDRDEEVVLPLAVLASKESYLANPIFLWGHAHRGAPDMALGTCVDLSGDATEVRAMFQYDVEITETAATVYKQVQKGTIRSVSIGFIPVKWVTRQSPEEDIDALPAHVATALRTGRIWLVHTAIELIEISQVFIGSNRQALALTAAFGDRAEDLLQRLGDFIKAVTAEEDDEMDEDENTVVAEDLPEEAAAEAPPEPVSAVEEVPASATVDEEAPAEEAAPKYVSIEDFAALKSEVESMRGVVKMLLSGAVKSGL